MEYFLMTPKYVLIDTNAEVICTSNSPIEDYAPELAVMIVKEGDIYEAASTVIGEYNEYTELMDFEQEERMSLSEYIDSCRENYVNWKY